MKGMRSILVVLMFFSFSLTAFAHQPRIPVGNNIKVAEPEISKAYYAQLGGEPQIYTISSDEEFLLYVNILVPDIQNQGKDLYVEVIKNGNTSEPVAILDGRDYEWTEFMEPFGHDAYLMGPEFESEVEAGDYEIRVRSGNNDLKYSLAVGKEELFDFKETVNAYKLIPKLKRDFFEKSPVDFIFSPLAWGLIAVMFVLGFAFGFIYRFILKRLSNNKVRKRHKNIGGGDRAIRLIISLALFVYAIMTTWSPVLLFFSGFTLFEAIFSWCGFYAAIGRNSCPV